MNTIIPNLPKNNTEIIKKAPKQTPPKTDEAIKGVLLNNYIKKQKTPFYPILRFLCENLHFILYVKRLLIKNFKQ